jgi:ribosome-associated protein
MSQRFRSQQRNLADCLERLTAMLAQVAKPPKKRRATRPSRTSIQRRREEKQRRSSVKSTRRAPRDEE